MTAQEMHETQRSTKRLGLGEALAGIAGLALLVLMLVPWFRWIESGIVITEGSRARSPHGTLTVWRSLDLMAYVLLISGLLAIGLALLRLIRSADSPIVTAFIVAGFGLVSSGLILKNIIMPPAGADVGRMVLLSAKVTPAIGSYLSLVAAIGITLGGVLAIRHRHRL